MGQSKTNLSELGMSRSEENDGKMMSCIQNTSTTCFHGKTRQQLNQQQKSWQLSRKAIPHPVGLVSYE